MIVGSLLFRVRGLLERTVFLPKAAPYILVLPFLVSFCMFFLFPLVSSVQMSMMKYEGFTESVFVGLDNYKALWNPRFFEAIRVTMTYTFCTIAILVPVPLFLAVLINSKSCIASTFFKSAYFIPQLTSVIVAGIFFRYAFSDTPTALINTIAGFFGADPVLWLKEKLPVMVAMVTLCVWRWFGVNLVYFLSSMQGISPELYEAAAIDGASAWRQFLHVTLPGLKPTIIYVITISVYGGFAMFSESYILFSSSRTPGDIAGTMVGYIYQMAFVEARLGFAAAAGIVLLVLVLVINIAQLNLFGMFKKEE